MEETCLTLSIGGLPPFSARGCSQVLTPIECGETHRTVNGDLVTTVSNLHHKYRTTIKGNDKLPIAMDRLWKGQGVDVGCIQRLWQKADDVHLQLSRTPVENSVLAISGDRQPVEILGIQGKTITLAAPGFVGYRPNLSMKITDFGYETSEWQDGVSWFLELEED
jgi:hypothetical protein